MAKERIALRIQREAGTSPTKMRELACKQYTQYNLDRDNQQVFTFSDGSQLLFTRLKDAK